MDNEPIYPLDEYGTEHIGTTTINGIRHSVNQRLAPLFRIMAIHPDEYRWEELLGTNPQSLFWAKADEPFTLPTTHEQVSRVRLAPMDRTTMVRIPKPIRITDVSYADGSVGVCFRTVEEGNEFVKAIKKIMEENNG